MGSSKQRALGGAVRCGGGGGAPSVRVQTITLGGAEIPHNPPSHRTMIRFWRPLTFHQVSISVLRSRPSTRKPACPAMILQLLSQDMHVERASLLQYIHQYALIPSKRTMCFEARKYRICTTSMDISFFYFIFILPSIRTDDRRQHVSHDMHDMTETIHSSASESESPWARASRANNDPSSAPITEKKLK